MRRVRLLTFSRLPMNCSACFGSDPATTIPALDELACRATVFENHYQQRSGDGMSIEMFGDSSIFSGAQFSGDQRCIARLSANEDFFPSGDRERLSRATLAWLQVEIPNDGAPDKQVAIAIEAATDLRDSDDDVLIVTGGACGPDPAGFGRFVSLLPEASVRVPLMIASRGQQASRVQSLTGSFDIAHTIRAAVLPDSAPINPSDGTISLLPLLDNSAKLSDRRLHIQLQNVRAIRTREFLFVERSDDPGSEPLAALYAKPEDVWNVHDVSVEYLDVVEALRKLWATAS